MNNPFFKNGALQRTVSMNRVFFASVPDNDIGDGCINKSAGEVFSSKVYLNFIDDYSDKLGIDAGLDKDSKLKEFDRCLVSEDINRKETAYKILSVLGKRLALLVYTLKVENELNKKNRGEWSDEHWKFWGTIENFVFAGGIIQGHPGDIIVNYSVEALKQLGLTGVNIRKTDTSRYLPLIGSARTVKNKDKALILDLGQSYIKRAVSYYENNEISKIEVLKPVPVKHELIYNHAETDDEIMEYAGKLFEDINEKIIDIYKENNPAEFHNTINIRLSIANYVDNGTIIKNKISYGKLQYLTDNLEKYFKESLERKTGRDVDLKLIHDATAAAMCFGGMKNTAVFTLGTAIGVGFPPEEDSIFNVETCIIEEK